MNNWKKERQLIAKVKESWTMECRKELRRVNGTGLIVLKKNQLFKPWYKHHSHPSLNRTQSMKERKKERDEEEEGEREEKKKKERKKHEQLQQWKKENINVLTAPPSHTHTQRNLDTNQAQGKRKQIKLRNSIAPPWTVSPRTVRASSIIMLLHVYTRGQLGCVTTQRNIHQRLLYKYTSKQVCWNALTHKNEKSHAQSASTVPSHFDLV